MKFSLAKEMLNEGYNITVFILYYKFYIHTQFAFH